MAEVAETTTKTTAGKYIQTIGRRKGAVAQVRLIKNGKGEVVVNERAIDKFFPRPIEQQLVLSPLVAVGQEDKLDFSVKVSGGGTHGQAEAVRMGIARALIELNPLFKKTLRGAGYLTRDARVKERKKPGLKKARKRTQWSKR